MKSDDPVPEGTPPSTGEELVLREGLDGHLASRAHESASVAEVGGGPAAELAPVLREAAVGLAVGDEVHVAGHGPLQGEDAPMVDRIGRIGHRRSEWGGNLGERGA